MKTTTVFAFLASVAIPLAVNADQNLKARHHDIAARSESNSTLTKRAQFSNTRFTFFDVGLGACGKWSKASDFMVALNDKQFGGGYPGPNCFKTITISYGGKTTQAQILDECPGCPFGGLDLSRGLFDFFAPESAGVIYGSWSFGGNGGDSGGGDDEPKTTHTTKKQDPTTTKEEPKPTTTKAARIKTKTSTSSSKTTSKTSSKPSSKTTSKTRSSTSASHSSIDYNDGNAAGLAVPTGTTNAGPKYLSKSLASVNQAVVQIGALIQANA